MRKQKPLPTLHPGMRVRHMVTDRAGFVVGRPEAIGAADSLVPVAVEGTTRIELWPLRLTKVRQKREQPVALGGNFKPPQGFPLHTRSK